MFIVFVFVVLIIKQFIKHDLVDFEIQRFFTILHLLWMRDSFENGHSCSKFCLR